MYIRYTCHKLRYSGPKLTKFLYNVEELLSFNYQKSALRSFSPFRNASATNEGGVGQFRKFGPQIMVTMATSLE